MTLAQLYYIVALDNHRHFSTAAEHCFVTQPTLSMQIQKLEEELNVLIFDRSKQPVVPTEMGAKIIKQARTILRESERLENMIDEEIGSFKGSLKIGIIPTIAPYLVPLFIKPFVTKYPSIELIMDELTTAEIVYSLNNDSIDAGIAALPIHDSDLIFKSLYYEPFVAYVAKKHKLSAKPKLDLDDLSIDDLLLLKEGHCLRGHTLKLCKRSEKDWNRTAHKILFESGNLDTLKKLVEQNFGNTLLPYLAVKDLAREEQIALVREFNPPVPKREIALAFSKMTLKKHLLSALEEEIVNVVPANLLKQEDSIIVR